MVTHINMGFVEYCNMCLLSFNWCFDAVPDWSFVVVLVTFFFVNRFYVYDYKMRLLAVYSEAFYTVFTLSVRMPYAGMPVNSQIDYVPVYLPVVGFTTLEYQGRRLLWYIGHILNCKFFGRCLFVISTTKNYFANFCFKDKLLFFAFLQLY